MTDIKSYSNGNVGVWWVPAGGIDDLQEPSAVEINAGVPLSGAIAWDSYELGNSDSDSVDDRSLLDVGNASSRGAAQFGATLSFFRDADPAAADSVYNDAFELFRTPRTYGYLVTRILQTTRYVQDDVAAGDWLSLYYMVADAIADDTEGDDSVKFNVTFQPQGQLAVYVQATA